MIASRSTTVFTALKRNRLATIDSFTAQPAATLLCGKGSTGTGFPKNSHNGSHPSSTVHSSSLSLGKPPNHVVML